MKTSYYENIFLLREDMLLLDLCAVKNLDFTSIVFLSENKRNLKYFSSIFSPMK